jgi:tetratricopeptide (TPR) repeat protein
LGLGDGLDGLGADVPHEAAALAAWSLLVAGDVSAAHRTFARAVQADADDLASWEGLRTAGEMLGDRGMQAGAAEQLGARCADPARGAAFWEEAALLWFDLDEIGRAETALDASVARDASRTVAFDRLFRLVRERKQPDRLLGLIAHRLEVTDDPPEIARLFWEQARALREKGDPDGALKALENVTMLEPDHVGGLALTGEICIKQRRYDEAAHALARLSTLQSAPARARVTAGVAAVDIYENKLKDFDKALAVLVGLHQAKLTTLPVRERLVIAASRTGAWRQATEMLEVLMHERTEGEGRVEAARLAMAIYRDRLNEPQSATQAVVRLLEESSADGEALDMLLQADPQPPTRPKLLANARATILQSLTHRPVDVPAIRRLVKIARATGDDSLLHASLGVFVAVGADPKAEEQLLQLASKKPRLPKIALSDATVRQLLASGDAGPIADLFMTLAPTLAEALGPSLQACGVSRRDRIDPRAGLGLRNEIAAWSGAFGIPEFDLYVGGKDPLGVQGVPGDPPALVVGAQVSNPLSPLTRARVARELFALVRGTTIARWRDDVSIAAITVAACRIAEVLVEHPPYATLAEIERLISKAISRKTKRLLPDLCRPIVESSSDPSAWVSRALLSQNRVSVLACGDVSLVLCDVLSEPLERLGSAVRGDARAEELLRFVLSPQYIELRKSLGLEGTP